VRPVPFLITPVIWVCPTPVSVHERATRQIAERIKVNGGEI
ncbi:MAG: hypothetical protein ACJATG_002398, partial [Dinoroseobacter sp.]